MTDESYKSAVAARINSMKSEKIFLEKLYWALLNDTNQIKNRLDLIDKQILAEKESVKDI